MKKTASIVLTLLLCMVMTSCSKTAREEKRLLKGMMSENYETSAKALSEFITWMQTDKATMNHDFQLMREKLGMKIVNSPDSLVRCYSWVTGQFENNASYANIIQWMTEGHLSAIADPLTTCWQVVRPISRPRRRWPTASTPSSKSVSVSSLFT